MKGCGMNPQQAYDELAQRSKEPWNVSTSSALNTARCIVCDDSLARLQTLFIMNLNGKSSPQTLSFDQ
jgi:hypothetical protein